MGLPDRREFQSWLGAGVDHRQLDAVPLVDSPLAVFPNWGDRCTGNIHALQQWEHRRYNRPIWTSRIAQFIDAELLIGADPHFQLCIGCAQDPRFLRRVCQGR